MLTQRSDGIKPALLKADVIPVLTELLRSGGASSAAQEARLCAVRALRFLASDTPACRPAMHNAGLLSVLAGVLAGGSNYTVETQMQAAETLAKFSRVYSDAILQSGAVPHLARISHDKTLPLTLRGSADVALSRIMSHGGPRATAAVQAAGGKGPSMRTRVKWLARRSMGTS